MDTDFDINFRNKQKPIYEQFNHRGQSITHLTVAVLKKKNFKKQLDHEGYVEIDLVLGRSKC